MPEIFGRPGTFAIKCFGAVWGDDDVDADDDDDDDNGDNVGL